MPADAISNILGGLTEATVGWILGLVTLWVVQKLSVRRRAVEYEVFKMPLLQFKPDNKRALTVSVDKFLLTGHDVDKGERVQVTSAYGFQISLQTVGNEDIDKPTIEITLDKSAKIIEFETDPVGSPAYEIVAQVDSHKPNVLRVSIPFLNRQQEILVRVLSTENVTPYCQVQVIGLGVHAYARRAGRRRRLLLAYSFFLPVIILLFIFAYADKWLPSTTLAALGGETRVLMPFWLQLVASAVLTVYLMIVAVVSYRVTKPKSRHPRGWWDWEQATASDENLYLWERLQRAFLVRQ